MGDFAAAEFEILKLLWQKKQLSSREIHESISTKTSWAYSTTRTVIERMVKKKYLNKNQFHSLNVYSPKISKVKAFAMQISSFAEKILEKDGLALIPLFAKNTILSAEELAELKKLLKSKGEQE